MTGDIAERGVLLRCVVGPDGAIVPDIEARLPGRGLWLTPRRDIVERAAAKRLFARAARRPVAAPADFADRIEALLARRCCDWLGLARRAGLAVAGFDRVDETVRHGKAALLLFAVDGAAAGRRKIAALDPLLPWAAVLSGGELGMTFGRDRVAHVALGAGQLSRRLLVELGRLSGFRADAAVGRGVEPISAKAELGSARQDGGSEPND